MFFLLFMFFVFAHASNFPDTGVIQSDSGSVRVAFFEQKSIGGSMELSFYGDCGFASGETVRMIKRMYIPNMKKEFVDVETDYCSGWIPSANIVGYSAVLDGSSSDSGEMAEFNLMLFLLYGFYALVITLVGIYKHKSTGLWVLFGSGAAVSVFAIMISGYEMVGIVFGLTIFVACLFVPASADPATLKKCPECAETVLKDAKVCKHCGNRFE